MEWYRDEQLHVGGVGSSDDVTAPTVSTSQCRTAGKGNFTNPSVVTCISSERVHVDIKNRRQQQLSLSCNRYHSTHIQSYFAAVKPCLHCVGFKQPHLKTQKAF